MKNRNLYWLIPLFVLTALLSFSINTAASVPKGISWYQGSIEEAFSEAQKKNRPLFLFWGAVWCPPCNQMKKTIFSNEAFKTAVKEFIPIYLDGDTKSAQIWGERLNVKGYPTTLIYSPNGKELLRFPSGVSVDKYVSLMKTSIQKMTPIEEVLKAVLSNKAEKEQWQIVASYAWDQDFKVITDANDKISTFKKLHESIPADLSHEKSMLLFHYLKALMENGSKTDPETRSMLIGKLNGVLSSDELVLSNFDILTDYASDVVSFLFETKDKNRENTIALWLSAMDRVQKNPSTAMSKHINSLYPMIALHQLDNPDKPVPEPIRETVRKQADRANSEVKNPYERHAVMSTVTWLLGETGQFELAEKMAKNELKSSHSPYYFMAVLGSLAKKQGKKDEALSWYQQSWETSEGHATRFERATTYMQNILALAPEKEELFRTTLLKSFDELIKEDDAFFGRKQGRLGMINKGIKEWNKNKSHDAFLTDLKKTLNEKCSSSSKSDACAAWVQNLGV